MLYDSFFPVVVLFDDDCGDGGNENGADMAGC